MDAFLLTATHFVYDAWLPLLMVVILVTALYKIARKENTGLTIFQRFIRLCFGFARCTHGFACAMDGAFLAYRQGKNEYAGIPVNESMYPAKPEPAYADLAQVDLLPEEA